MKPFQQWLAAPVALGLIAPLGVSAGELNVSDFNKYSGPSGVDQVTSIDQFPDVKPTDWAYQALSNLIERYGCVAGYPDGTFRGGKAMTRYEAAALLNACLDRITEITDELKRSDEGVREENSPSCAVVLMASKPRWVNWKPPSSPPPPCSRVMRCL
jgi:hypothetical protein